MDGGVRCFNASASKISLPVGLISDNPIARFSRPFGGVVAKIDR